MSLMLKKYKFTIFHLLRDKVPNALRLHFYIRLMQMSMGACHYGDFTDVPAIAAQVCHY